ncbi:hypothetical protein A4X09_0g6082 [Tilletia walkeri]|uniref:Extracellular membrane protein CFEM domain-containing protein n=1 Tax=Tilletia walkeri TaxID=117179 RepID=A0A8X7N4H6_9BASI|nr:hypothetical protein A4X09_0g6082 [Tilletia walkeri]
MARSGSTLSLLFIFSLFLALAIHSVHAGKDDEAPLKKGATCSKSKSKLVQACLENVYSEEEALPRGPCYSDDVECYCMVQQGIIDCWEDNGCGNAQPKSQITWNNANCAGQKGFSNKAAGGDLVFDLSKVNSANATPEPTPTGKKDKKKDHKKHKHHKGKKGKKADDEEDSTDASPSATEAPLSDAASSSAAYAYSASPYITPPVYAVPNDNMSVTSSASASVPVALTAAAGVLAASTLLLLVGA